MLCFILLSDEHINNVPITVSFRHLKTTLPKCSRLSYIQTYDYIHSWPLFLFVWFFSVLIHGRASSLYSSRSIAVGNERLRFLSLVIYARRSKTLPSYSNHSCNLFLFFNTKDSAYLFCMCSFLHIGHKTGVVRKPALMRTSCWEGFIMHSD